MDKPNMFDIVEMQKEIERLREQVKNLHSSINHWKRLAKQDRHILTCVRRGYSRGEEYRILVIDYIPGGLPIKEVIEHLKADFLPHIEPWKFERIDWSNRYKGWLVQVYKAERIDLYVDTSKTESLTEEERAIFDREFEK